MKITTNLKNFSRGIIPLIFIFIVLFSISFSDCKNFGAPDWELEVTMGDGVSGTPDVGKYIYQELETIDYNYYPIDDRLTVQVYVNGSRWSPAGQFVLYTNLKVEVSLFDIRGTWIFTYKEDDTDTELDFTLTFTGEDMLSGNFTDDRGYVGSWEIVDSTLTMTFGNWQSYVFTGTVPTMSGTYTNGTTTGTWSAQR